MTTTTETEPATDGVPEKCPNCDIPLSHVEGTDITNCNHCGQTFGTATAEPVEPDEVITASAASQHRLEARAAESALAEFDAHAAKIPIIPGMEEMHALATQARIMAMSGIVPKALQGKPADVFVVLLTGRDLGVPITAAVNLIHVIEGRPSIAPKLLNARLRQLGVGSILKFYSARDKAVVCALEPGGRFSRACLKAAKTNGGEHLDDCACEGIIGETEFNWSDAILGGLVMPDCTPEVHTAKCKAYASRPFERCRQGYRTYPGRMMLWRASGWCADEYFPEAQLGLYSPEELGALVDEDGEPIDPGSIALPPGFEPPPVEVNPLDEPAAPEAVALLKARVAHLPLDERRKMLARWAEKVNEGRLNNVDHLTIRQEGIANALVNGAEATARAADKTWHPYEPPAGTDGEAPDPAQAAMEEPDAGIAPAEPPEVVEGPVEEPPPAVAEQPTLAPPRPYEDRHLDAAIAAVSILTVRALNAALRDRVMAVDGVEENVRRQNLCVAMATEAAQSERDDAAPRG